MANRSYLYTCDDIPTADGKVKPRGLCEFNYGIPIVHKLMVASAPRVVRSAIWGEHDIGILGDRAGAVERTVAFVDKLSAGDVADRADWGWRGRRGSARISAFSSWRQRHRWRACLRTAAPLSELVGLLVVGERGVGALV